MATVNALDFGAYKTTPVVLNYHHIKANCCNLIDCICISQVIHVNTCILVKDRILIGSSVCMNTSEVMWKNQKKIIIIH